MSYQGLTPYTLHRTTYICLTTDGPRSCSCDSQILRFSLQLSLIRIPALENESVISNHQEENLIVFLS